MQQPRQWGLHECFQAARRFRFRRSTLVDTCLLDQFRSQLQVFQFWRFRLSCLMVVLRRSGVRRVPAAPGFQDRALQAECTAPYPEGSHSVPRHLMIIHRAQEGHPMIGSSYQLGEFFFPPFLLSSTVGMARPETAADRSSSPERWGQWLPARGVMALVKAQYKEFFHLEWQRLTFPDDVNGMQVTNPVFLDSRVATGVCRMTLLICSIGLAAIQTH